MAKKPSKPAVKRGKAKIAAPVKKAKARTKKPSKTARKKAARTITVRKSAAVGKTERMVEDVTDRGAGFTVHDVQAHMRASFDQARERFRNDPIEVMKREAVEGRLKAIGNSLDEAAARGVERAQAQKPRWWTRFKSAVSGLFVSPKQSEADPDGTYGTRLRRKG